MALGRTPRELLASVTSAEITEAMAFERLEPFGSLHAEFLAGQVCATLANLQRDPRQRSQPWTASDFMPALARALADAGPRNTPSHVDDPEAMSRLIKSAVFGIPS